MTAHLQGLHRQRLLHWLIKVGLVQPSLQLRTSHPYRLLHTRNEPLPHTFHYDITAHLVESSGYFLSC